MTCLLTHEILLKVTVARLPAHSSKLQYLLMKREEKTRLRRKKRLHTCFFAMNHDNFSFRSSRTRTKREGEREIGYKFGMYSTFTRHRRINMYAESTEVPCFSSDQIKTIYPPHFYSNSKFWNKNIFILFALNKQWGICLCDQFLILIPLVKCLTWLQRNYE